MLDIGCGPGGQVALAGSLGITPRGIDNEPNVDPHVLHDFTDGPIRIRPLYDLGWCVDFLDHVEERYLPNVASAFQRCKVVVITHTLPGRSDRIPVNCQKPYYWREWFKRQGFKYLPESTHALKAASTMNREFIQQTGAVFEKEY